MPEIERILAGDRPPPRRPPLWDGRAAERIAAVLAGFDGAPSAGKVGRNRLRFRFNIVSDRLRKLLLTCTLPAPYAVERGYVQTDRVEPASVRPSRAFPRAPHPSRSPTTDCAAEPRLDAERLRLVPKGLLAPLFHRIRRGEGGLLVVNATLAWQYRSVGEAVGLTLASLLCLLALYLFNDIVDAPDDRHNPKKDRQLASEYAQERSLFLALWLVTTGLAVLAGAAVEPRAALWVGAVSGVNVVYSLLCKKVPFVDIVWVALWGGAYASIATDATGWIVLVAAMTAVCHIYQISEDRGADAASGIATSATLRASVQTLLQAALTGVLAAAAWSVSGSLVALTLLALFAYWLAWRDRPGVGWIVAKVHFSFVWAYLLVVA